MTAGSRRSWAVSAAVVAIALLLRIGYALNAQVVAELPGDIQQHVQYAVNLQAHGVYSSGVPDVPGGTPPPDTFRSPGYPLFLLAAMTVAPDRWIAVAKAVQVLLGTGTVLLVILLGRHWLRPCWANAAAAGLALWPHAIVFASTLLGETLFGFLLVLAAWLASAGARRASPPVLAIAGVAFGAAALVNPLVLLFPPVLACVLYRRLAPRPALCFLAAFLALPLAWTAAAPAVESGQTSGSRVMMNLVQGSWPQYHAAWRTQHNNAVSRAIIAAIDAEIAAVSRSPEAGARQVAARMADDPAWYARWYLLGKPYDLWDWDIRIGWGDIYFLDTTRSPFVSQPVPRLVAAIAKAMNPWLFAAASAGVLLVLARAWRRRDGPIAPVAVALLLLYVTALHAVLQAEPRYSVPYRGFEMLAAAHALAAAWAFLRQRRAGSAAPGSAPGTAHADTGGHG